ncbi:hypothetical protein DFP73DRAFT_402018 [Morchella snyderi]|nr:hypothetical protein DFP73DRAFT_402018 [Morchella snyderi]
MRRLLVWDFLFVEGIPSSKCCRSLLCLKTFQVVELDFLLTLLAFSLYDIPFSAFLDTLGSLDFVFSLFFSFHFLFHLVWARGYLCKGSGSLYYY